MRYQRVQNYQLVDSWLYKTDIATDRIIRTYYIDLDKGVLTMRKGFCFENSGPTFSTKTFMRAACAHDAGYWLIRNGHLEPTWKEPFDYLCHELCRKDGMNRLRAWWVLKALLSSDFSIDPKNRVKVQTAP